MVMCDDCFGGETIYYAIHATKTVGGDVISVPVVTLESKSKALDALKAAIKSDAVELDAPPMRWVGARVEYTLEQTESITGLIGGDVIAIATVKRPVNSPKAEIWITFNPGEPQQRVDIGDL